MFVWLVLMFCKSRSDKLIMAMRASVSIYVLVNVIAHGELERLVVREVAQLAMNRVVFVQWKVTRLLPDLPQKSRSFDFDEPD